MLFKRFILDGEVTKRFKLLSLDFFLIQVDVASHFRCNIKITLPHLFLFSSILNFNSYTSFLAWLVFVCIVLHKTHLLLQQHMNF